jgi:hypothetical protein
MAVQGESKMKYKRQYRMAIQGESKMKYENYGKRFDGYYSRACEEVDQMVIDNLISERAARTGLKIKKEESSTIGMIGIGLLALASIVVASKIQWTQKNG